MNEIIPYGQQEILQSDMDAVLNTLKSPFITQGDMVPAFENAICQKVGAKHAVAVNSATSALHLAALALGLKKGDFLWSSPISFVASSNCALFCGAGVDFCDIDLRSFNMDLNFLENKLKKTPPKRRPKVVVAVHFGGSSCKMKELDFLAQKWGFKIIEDASHALGGFYKEEAIGSCKYSSICVFSFHPVKIITSAEGGICVSNSEKLAQKMQELRTHGITKQTRKMRDKFGLCGGFNLIESSADSIPKKSKKQEIKKQFAPWYYEMQNIGYNYRLSDIHAALGCSQLNRLEKYIQIRNEIAKFYSQKFAKTPLVPQFVETQNLSAYHLYCVLAQNKKERAALFSHLQKHKIAPQVHYLPIHLQPFYAKKFGFKLGDFPNAENYYFRTISLPLFPSLSEEQIQRVCSAVLEFYK